MWLQVGKYRFTVFFLISGDIRMKSKFIAVDVMSDYAVRVFSKLFSYPTEESGELRHGIIIEHAVRKAKVWSRMLRSQQRRCQPRKNACATVLSDE